MKLYRETPHGVQKSPGGVASRPRDARVRTDASTDNQPAPRQEGYGVFLPWLRQVRDGTGEGGWAREQLHA